MCIEFVKLLKDYMWIEFVQFMFSNINILEWLGVLADWIKSRHFLRSPGRTTSHIISLGKPKNVRLKHDEQIGCRLQIYNIQIHHKIQIHYKEKRQQWNPQRATIFRYNIKRRRNNETTKRYNIQIHYKQKTQQWNPQRATIFRYIIKGRHNNETHSKKMEWN